DLNGTARLVWDRGAYEYGAPTTNPVISVSPAALVFGVIPTSTTRDASFTVQNSGLGTLSGAATSNAPYSIVSGGNYSLPAGQSQAVTVRFSPWAVGTNSQNVIFTGGGGAVV